MLQVPTVHSFILLGSAIERHLDCFQVWAVVSKAAMNICVELLWERKSSFL